MQIQINTDHNIKVHKLFAQKITSVIENALDRLTGQITRVEVHLSDENGSKTGSKDKRCLIEARLEGHQPVAVTHHAPTVELAVQGASGKLTRLIQKTVGRLNHIKNHKTDPPIPVALH